MNKIHRLISWIVATVVLVTATVALVCPAAATKVSKISMVDNRATLCASEGSASDFGMASLPCFSFHSTTLNRLAAIIPASFDFLLLVAVALALGFMYRRELLVRRHAVFERWRRFMRLYTIIKFSSTQKLVRWFAQLNSLNVALAAV